MQKDRLEEMCNNTSKVFIPASVIGKVFEKNFLNANKLIILGIGLAVEIWVGSKVFQDANIIKFILFLIVTYAVVLVYRKFVFEEKRFREVSKEIMNNNFSGDYFNNIRGFKEYSDYTFYILGNQIIGTVIRLSFESIVGKEDDDIHKHFDSISNMIKLANEYGYCIKWKEVQETKNKDQFMNKVNKEINKYKHSKMAEKLLRNILESSIIETRDRYNDTLYIVIYRKEVRFDYGKIVEEIDNIINELNTSLIENIELLDREETDEFLFKRNGVTTGGINNRIGDKKAISRVINSMKVIKEDGKEEIII